MPTITIHPHIRHPHTSSLLPPARKTELENAKQVFQTCTYPSGRTASDWVALPACLLRCLPFQTSILIPCLQRQHSLLLLVLSLSSSLCCSRLDLLSLRVIIIVVVIMPPKGPFRHRSATVLPSFGGGGVWVPLGATQDYCRWGMEGKRVYMYTVDGPGA